MSAVVDTPGCGFGADDLLPARAGERDDVPEATARHVTQCPICATTLAQRKQVAAELRALPRLNAPRHAQSALQLSAILARLDERRADDRLVAEEGLVRRWLASVARLRAPDTLRAPIPGLRPSRRLVLVRAAALAAAAALVAAATLVPGFRSSRGVARGLAEQTAALNDRAPIELRGIQHLDPRSPGPRPLDVALPPVMPARKGGP